MRRAHWLDLPQIRERMKDKISQIETTRDMLVQEMDKKSAAEELDAELAGFFFLMQSLQFLFLVRSVQVRKKVNKATEVGRRFSLSCMPSCVDGNCGGHWKGWLGTRPT